MSEIPSGEKSGSHERPNITAKVRGGTKEQVMIVRLVSREDCAWLDRDWWRVENPNRQEDGKL